MTSYRDRSQIRLWRLLTTACGPEFGFTMGFQVIDRPLDVFCPLARLAVLFDTGTGSLEERGAMRRWIAQAEEAGLAIIVVDPEELRTSPRMVVQRVVFVVNLRTRWRGVFEGSAKAA